MSTADLAAFKTPVEGEPTRFLLGPVVQFLAKPEETSEQFTVLRSTLPPSVVIPLHSHREAEWSYVLEGAVEVWSDRRESPHWLEVTAPESVLIPSQARHAIRNTSRASAVVILVTAASLAHFFVQISVPITPGEQPSLPLTGEIVERFLVKQAEYGYWSGSREENAVIGVHLDPW